MSDPFVDLRSDTQTRPTPGMRQAIAAAEVGDDTIGEDPTVNRLEVRLAELLGKEAAVFACTATQANQMAVWTHCRSGDELLIEENGHIGSYEAGAPAALTGVSVRKLRGDAGRLDVDVLAGALRPGSLYFSPTRLVCVENSTNIGGGRTYPLEQLARVGRWAHEQGIKVHLDGARLFNAAVALKVDAREIARHVDSVQFCLSKGLSAPVGSIVAGDAAFVARARRIRKLVGGGMRQAGIIAAAGIVALEQMVERLAEDHANARLLAEGLATFPQIAIDLATVQTDIVIFRLREGYGSPDTFMGALAERGLLVGGIGRGAIRAVTHYGIDAGDIEEALEVVRATLAAL